MEKIVKTYTLKEPIPIGEGTLKELKFIKPKAKHMRHFKENTQIGDLLDLACLLTKRKAGDLDEMSIEDMHEVNEITSSLVKPGS